MSKTGDGRTVLVVRHGEPDENGRLSLEGKNQLVLLCQMIDQFLPGWPMVFTQFSDLPCVAESADFIKVMFTPERILAEQSGNDRPVLKVAVTSCEIVNGFPAFDLEEVQLIVEGRFLANRFGFALLIREGGKNSELWLPPNRRYRLPLLEEAD